jgi:hypothetical protein
MCQELQIFAFVYMYWDAKLSPFRLCDSDFGITPVDVITIGIIIIIIIIIIISSSSSSSSSSSIRLYMFESSYIHQKSLFLFVFPK